MSDARTLKRKLFLLFTALYISFLIVPVASAEDGLKSAAPASSGVYAVNADDILTISVLQPDHLTSDFTVSPDGSITFPYIGNVDVKGATLIEVQNKIQTSLSEYMKYPVVVVSLKESRSRMFYVYGEVNKPGTYPVQPNLTVMKVVSMAGGFTRLASSNVKILRTPSDGSGTQMLEMNVNDVMQGKEKDMDVQPGDVITAGKSIF